MLHVHDLVDYVSEEAGAAGIHAAAYILGSGPRGSDAVPVRCSGGVRYTVPGSIRIQALKAGEKVTVRFRVDNVYSKKKVNVYVDDTLVFSRFRKILAPGEMETIQLRSRDLRHHDIIFP